MLRNVFPFLTQYRTDLSRFNTVFLLYLIYLAKALHIRLLQVKFPGASQLNPEHTNASRPRLDFHSRGWMDINETFLIIEGISKGSWATIWLHVAAGKSWSMKLREPPHLCGALELPAALQDT